jgi:predicted acylesterase/phospholipase RssA
MIDFKTAREIAMKDKGLDLVLSAGGSRAILGGAGALIAIVQVLGSVEMRMRSGTMWNSIGGVSGGAIPAALYAAGYSAKETLQMAIAIDFSSKLVRHGSVLQILFAYFMQGRFERTRPRTGVLSSEPFGEWINGIIPGWPAPFWTKAVVGEDDVLFDKNGVRLIQRSTGKVTILSEKPADIGLAIRATIAVPGIISAVPYKGRYLFDGALTPDGSCPVDMPIRHYGATHPTTIACEVGDDGTTMSGKVVKLWKLICGQDCVPSWKDQVLTEQHGMIVVKPNMKHFPSLQFTLTRDQKWMAVMTSYMSAVEALKRAGLAHGEKLAQMEEICATYRDIEHLGKHSEGLLSMCTEDLLSKHGLW